MSKRAACSALGLICGLWASTSLAVQQPSYLPADGIALFDGRPARQVRVGASRPPAAQLGSWRSFESDMGGQWLAIWDESTGVPTRIFGSGVSAPNTSTSSKAGARFSRAMLKRHLPLLAPGADAKQFQLVSNVTSGGQRIVAFQQHHRGLPVKGGQVSFRYRNDRLYVIASEAKPAVTGAPPATLVDDKTASAKAVDWLLQDGMVHAEATAVGDALILPLIGPSRVYGYRTVIPVTVSTKPLARYQVYVDATTGQPVAREQTLRFASGTVMFNAPERFPGGQRLDYPARNADAIINNATSILTDAQGIATFDGNSTVAIEMQPDGSLVGMSNQTGPLAMQSLSLAPGGTAVWNAQDNAPVDAQLSAFVHTQVAKQHGKDLGATLGWLNAKLPVRVNYDDVCNAFYDGSSINFFSQSNPCENTARLADVVYHEFGHGFHHQSVIAGSGNFESALSEGVSDFYAAAITNDSAMGRGFFYTAAPLREIDPEGSEAVWPQDIGSDPHATGLIIGGALWDLRKLLMAKHGDAEGAAITDSLFYQGIRNASDIPTMFPEVLAADDDDGNLENGTPNVCEIIEAFGIHGLRTLDAEAGALSIEPPDKDGYEVTVKVSGLYAQCPGDSLNDVRLSWRLRRIPNQVKQLDMTGGPTEFSATIPKQKAGEVVQYDVRVNLSAGSQLSFPDNAADPRYEFFVGDVIPLYCTDFETDPELDGWTHGLSQGSPDEGADDWQWDEPLGTSTNGDPTSAFSGLRVFGNDLGHDNFNGLYQPDKTNFADSPVIDVGDYSNVRLQYRRWLNVEDGFFDRASIYVNNKSAWSNLASNNEQTAQVHHRDREWRFHDVDLSDDISGDNTVQLRFEIRSDGGLEFGGWSIDDLCVVAYEGPPPIVTECGNGVVEPGEACDDGNLIDGDGCDSECTVESDAPANEPTGDIIVEGCGCRTAGTPTNTPMGIVLLGAAAALLRRRRRDS